MSMLVHPQTDLALFSRCGSIVFAKVVARICAGVWLIGLVAFGLSDVVGQDSSTNAVQLDRANGAITLEDVEFFENKIRPVLIEYCYECHSVEHGESEGGLTLDHRSGWQTGGDSGPAIIPSDVDASLLIEAIRYDGLEMPPSGRLSESIISDFEAWVARGAPDPRTHVNVDPASSLETDLETKRSRPLWSLQRLQAVNVPTIAESEWANTTIDVFIKAKLEELQLSPVADAQREQLARRLAFDLTGLPIPNRDLVSFVNDKSPDALDRLIDRLMASPAFGEQWGRHWLDVARYADSNGSDFNATFHNAWRYRNYVIDSFNQDRRYDDFVRHQIAGDLLPYEDDQQRSDQIVATGFLMLGAKMLSERDKAKLEMDVIDEQLDVIGRTFMGLTLGCARCHDHKFDPIDMEDYYALAGILKSTHVLEGEIQKYVSNWRRSDLPISEARQSDWDAYQQQMNQLSQVVDEATEQFTSLQSEWKTFQNEWLGLYQDDHDAEPVGDWKTSTYSPEYFGDGYRHDDNKAKGDRKLIYRIALAEAGWYEVRASYTDNSGRSNSVPYSIVHSSGTTTVHVDQTREPEIAGILTSLGQFHFDEGLAEITLSNDSSAGHVIADVVQLVPVTNDGPRTSLDDELSNSADTSANIDQRDASTTVDRRNESVSQPNADSNAFDRDEPLSTDDETAIDFLQRIARSKRSITQSETALNDHKANSPAALPKAFAVSELDEIQDCAIRIRGDANQIGDVVPRNIPHVFELDSPVQFSHESSGRLELATWISAPQHPLTARVIVNRVWSKLLGRGIVSSHDNFGHLGARPTHPELLDYLAVEFVRRDWSIKWLVREIALSRVYQLDSRPSEFAREHDPTNRWLSHFSRRPMMAESLRDSLLVLSRQLDSRMGRSPVEGYPTLAIDNNNQNARAPQSQSQMRTVYLPIIRNELPPMLTVFDFADPNMVVGERAQTSVPAQSLLLLNDPFVRQCCERVAEQLLAEVPAGVVERLHVLHTTIFSRPMNSTQERVLSDYVNRQLDYAVNDQERSEQDVWTELIGALVATAEFRTID